MQNLKEYMLPEGFRGRNPYMVQLWWFVQATLFRLSPRFLYGWRRFLLRLFGAQIGKRVLVRPTAQITFPWRVKIGAFSWIGDDVCLYSLGEISIGMNTVISQKSYLCAASHKYDKNNFPIYTDPIVVGDGCWLATDVFVGPGVTIGNEAVVGARSSVFKDLEGKKVFYGTPAKFIKERSFE
jgi:putative colanic acid biosynthesis acetyltransferase WcaF